MPIGHLLTVPWLRLSRPALFIASLLVHLPACGSSSLGDDRVDGGGPPAADTAADRADLGAPGQTDATLDLPSLGPDAPSALDLRMSDTGGADGPSPGPSPPGSCGGGVCAANQYCNKPCDAPTSQGVCAPKPEACLSIIDPVCGCDGKTYGNPCSAASSGVSQRHDGPCP